ncbi:MAG TPA: hypothetical protein VGM41_18965, partial [Chitinophagaceae bacterium]
VLLLEEEYDDPKRVIVQFFDANHLQDALSQLKSCLKAAFSKRRLRRRTLLSMMAFREDMLRLLEAATLLKDEGKSTIPEDAADPLATSWYCASIGRDYTEWDYLPRHLSRKQYFNPYRVFKQCSNMSTLPEWRVVIEGLIDAAAYRGMEGEDGCICHSNEEPNAYSQCKRLVELVEAAHLIYVRERLFDQDKQQQQEEAA